MLDFNRFEVFLLLVTLHLHFNGSLAQELCNANAFSDVYVNGKCVTFDECPPYLQILKSPDKTTAEIRILQNLTCLRDFENPKICCALEDLVFDSKNMYEVNSNLKPVSNDHSLGAIVYPTDYPRSKLPPPGTSTTTRPPDTLIMRDIKNDTINVDASNQSLGGRFGKQVHKHFRLLPSLKECSNPVSTDRVVGGTNAAHGAFPWMAQIGYKILDGGNKTEFYCGGTIISKRYILTASHCSEEIDSSEMEISVVRLGEYNLSEKLDCSPSLPCSQAEDYKIEKVIPHKGYNTLDKKNDIELIRVNRDISFDTPFIRPVCLPFSYEYKIDHQLRTEDLSQFIGTKGIVTGWGRTKWNKAVGSKILQEVALPIVSNEECQKNYSTRTTLSDMQLCAGGEKNKDSCSGDSGGCLVVPVKIQGEDRRFRPKLFQLGVVSFGPVHCGIGGLPGVYSRVSKYKKWILDNIEP